MVPSRRGRRGPPPVEDGQLSERAKEIKRQIDEGTYRVDVEKLAERILDQELGAPGNRTRAPARPRAPTQRTRPARRGASPQRDDDEPGGD
jgi:hypothetical protein